MREKQAVETVGKILRDRFVFSGDSFPGNGDRHFSSPDWFQKVPFYLQFRFRAKT